MAEHDLSIFNEYKRDLRNHFNIVSNLEGTDKTIFQDFNLNRLYRDYSEQLGFNKRDIARHLVELMETPEIDSKSSYTLNELFEEEDDLSNWLVPRLYRKCGLYIVGAGPKTYKSMSMYDLAYSITTSGIYLDSIPCLKGGRVVYYQVEEPKATMKKRLIARGFKDDEEFARKNDLLRIERKFNLKTDLPKLDRMLSSYSPDLVIFDTLRAITFMLDVSENSTDFAKYIYALQMIFISHNKTGILLHHKNKTAGATGLSSLSGSLSIGGASDGIVLMSSLPADMNSVKLETIPRDAAPVEFILRRQRMEGGRWKFVLDHEKDVSDSTVANEKKILRYLADASPTYLAKTEILTGAGFDRKDPDANFALERLVEAEILECLASKRVNGKVIYEYRLHPSSPWIVNFKPEANDNKPIIIKTIGAEVAIANLIANSATKAELLKITENLSSTQKDAVWNILSVSEKQKLQALVESEPAFTTGSSVVQKKDKEVVCKVINAEFCQTKHLWEYKLENIKGVFLEEELESVPSAASAETHGEGSSMGSSE